MSGDIEKALLALAEMERAIRQTHFLHCGESWTSRGLHSPGCMLWCLYDAEDAAALRGAAARLDTWGFVGPCAHGRDPYTCCNKCELLSPVDAAVAAEREACAKLVEAVKNDCRVLGFGHGALDGVSRALASAIRARGAR